MSVPTAPSAQSAIEQLRATVRGGVMTPTDPGYDAQRTVMIGGVDPRPAVIARVADARDVAAAIAVARRTGLDLAVRAGGHSGAGHSTVDGGLVIDLRDLKTLEIDPDARTAWADAGLTAFEVTSGAAKHGLGIGFGVDYGIYIVSRAIEEHERQKEKQDLRAALIEGVATAGKAVLYTAFLISAGIAFWAFSPLRFQAEMGYGLLIILTMNMLGGLLLLPALISLIRPRFVLGGKGA